MRALQERLDDADVAFTRATHTAPSDAKVYNSHGVVLGQVYTFYQYKHTHSLSHTHVRHAYYTLSHTCAPHTAAIPDSHGVVLEQVYT